MAWRTVILLILIFFSGNLVAQTKETLPSAKAVPIVLGRTEVVSSKVLGEERRINIYLPEGYNPSASTKYPVIYLLDGGLDEDFIHVCGLVQFCSFPWVNRVPNVIVVGIANTDRKRDMTFPTSVKGDQQKYPTQGGSSNFIKFIEHELQPYIKSHYATNNDCLLIGESLGGLLATEILLTRAQMFNRYLIISPSLWWDNGSILKRKMPVLPDSTRIFIAAGKEGLAPSEEPHVMEVDANILVEKIQTSYKRNSCLYFDYLPAENHATIGHQAIYNGFKKLYKLPDAE